MTALDFTGWVNVENFVAWLHFNFIVKVAGEKNQTPNRLKQKWSGGVALDDDPILI